jgi:hypothetical protein
MGPMGVVQASVFGWAVGDPNADAGPGGEYQGRVLLDPRFWFGKDQVQGYVGKVPGHYQMPQVRSVNQIPAAVSSSNIAAAQGVTSGVPMTLASANATGITINVPYIPFTQAGLQQLATGASVQTAPITLDFGFAFGNVAAGNAAITVADSSQFFVGMPLVIAGAGNAAGTVPLLTSVASIVSLTAISVNNTPLATVNPAAIGTGNLWGPTETWSNLINQTPTAALPWLAAGPSLSLDPRQALTRSVQIVGSSGGTGGTFTVRALDIYNIPLTMTITVAAGASTGYGTKAVKALLSVTPNFTDLSHNYTVGTSDVFGMHYRTPFWEDTEVSWAGLYMSSTTGFVAATTLQSAPSTATTGDVRGTIQTSGTGGGSGIGASASNGTVSSLAMSGNRLMIQQSLPINQVQPSNPVNFQTLFGVTQA